MNFAFGRDALAVLCCVIASGRELIFRRQVLCTAEKREKKASQAQSRALTFAAGELSRCEDFASSRSAIVAGGWIFCKRGVIYRIIRALHTTNSGYGSSRKRSIYDVCRDRSVWSQCLASDSHLGGSGILQENKQIELCTACDFYDDDDVRTASCTVHAYRGVITEPLFRAEFIGLELALGIVKTVG